jgi:hypothetical protein
MIGLIFMIHTRQSNNHINQVNHGSDWQLYPNLAPCPAGRLSTSFVSTFIPIAIGASHAPSQYHKMS